MIYKRCIFVKIKNVKIYGVFLFNLLQGLSFLGIMIQKYCKKNNKIRENTDGFTNTIYRKNENVVARRI